MSLIVFPDWLAGLSEWLRDQDELAELVGDRVYTELPGAKTFPLVIVNQINDPSITEDIHWAVDALFQVDVWADRKTEAGAVAETTRALLSQRFARSVHHMAAGSFAVSRVRVGGVRRLGDDVVSVARDASGKEVATVRQRSSFDFAAVMRPAAASGS